MAYLENGPEIIGSARMARRSQSGFTLIELLVVLVILGLLASLVGPRVMKHVGESKSKTAALQIEQLSNALEIYRLEVGNYPSNEQGLLALVEKPAGVSNWNGPYLAKSVVRKDPWGADYLYRYPGEKGSYDIWTLGSDGMEGGEGENRDVNNWE